MDTQNLSTSVTACGDPADPTERLAKLLRLGHRMATVCSLREAAETVVDAADELLSWDACHVDLYLPKTDELERLLLIDIVDGTCQVMMANPPSRPNWFTRTVLAGQARLIQREQYPIPDDLLPVGGTACRATSMLFVPIREGTRVSGILSIQKCRREAYDLECLKLLQVLADYCGAAFQRIGSRETVTRLEEEYIAERRHSRARIKEADERYRALFHRSLDAVYLHDLEGRFLDANPAALQMFGYTLAEIDSLDFSSLVTSEQDLARARQSIHDLLALGVQKQIAEYRLRRRNGTIVDVELMASLVFREGRPPLIQGIARDITERKRAEARLRLLSGAVEAAANAIIITDRRGVIQWANAAFTTFTGYTPAETIGRSPADLLKSGKHDQSLYRGMWEIILSGKVWCGEMINRRKDGSFYPEEMTITPLKNGRDEITHFIAVKQDITERKRLEAQYLRAQRMESIGALASGIAHNLNNVLAPILISIDLLRLNCADPKVKDLLEGLETRVQRGTQLVKQVLSFGRGSEARRTTVDLNHLIKEVGEMVRDTFPKAIEYCCTAERDLWPVTGDPTQLEQVILNLCVNARDAMPNGGRLAVTLKNVVLDDVGAKPGSTPKPGTYVRIVVADTGMGIPVELQERVFEAFFTSKKTGEGTGLGLSTSLAIVKSHGGWIELDSEVDTGATFKIHLPAARAGSNGS